MSDTIIKQDSFQPGWLQVQQQDAPVVKEKIMKVFGIKPTNRESWSQRLKGLIEPTRSQAIAVEEIFAELNISKEKVWGIYEASTKQKTT